MKKKFMLEVDVEVETPTEMMVNPMGTLREMLDQRGIKVSRVVEVGEPCNYETNPGKYSSRTGHWYFSCDTGHSTLVGVKDATSTCPIVGIIQHTDDSKIDDPGVIKLEEYASTRTYIKNNYDGVAVGFVSYDEWNKCMEKQRDPKEEWVTTELICLMFTEVGVFELHWACE